MKYRIVHDTLLNVYRVEQRYWWWPLWESFSIYSPTYESYNQAFAVLERLKMERNRNRHQTVYKE